MDASLRVIYNLKHENQDDSLCAIGNQFMDSGSCPKKILTEAMDTPTRGYWAGNFDTAFGVTIRMPSTHPLDEKRVIMVNSFYLCMLMFNGWFIIVTQYNLLRNVKFIVLLYFSPLKSLFEIYQTLLKWIKAFNYKRLNFIGRRINPILLIKLIQL